MLDICRQFFIQSIKTHRFTLFNVYMPPNNNKDPLHSVSEGWREGPLGVIKLLVSKIMPRD